MLNVSIAEIGLDSGRVEDRRNIQSGRSKRVRKREIAGQCSRSKGFRSLEGWAVSNKEEVISHDGEIIEDAIPPAKNCFACTICSQRKTDPRAKIVFVRPVE